MAYLGGMVFETPHTAIRLDTCGDCPRCGRPLLSLGEDTCAFCERSLAPGFETFPAVASALESLARGWTLERLKTWAAPRPSQLAWALDSGLWRNLGYFVSESLWGGWANRHASLRGRRQAHHVEGITVERMTLCGIAPEAGWVALRFEGTRLGFRWDPAQGWPEDGLPEPHPFRERWTFQTTGFAEESPGPTCGACGAPSPLTVARCPYCGAPAAFRPGPWLLIDLRAERIAPTTTKGPSPFEGYGGTP